MLKYLIAVFGLIFVVLIWINFGVGVQSVYNEVFPEPITPHIYNNPNQTIAKIEITALYFIPRNKTNQQFDGWRTILRKNMRDLEKFHNLQFQDRSQISYNILDTPIVGWKDNLEYDTEITQHGNPEGLRRIAAELNERGIYQESMSVSGSEVYRVVLILYEGVGASGSDNVALVSRIFYTDPQYQNIRATILAHEFYHTLGLPDAYEISSAVPTSLDIMGLGLSRPIEKNFISRDALKAMGI